MLTSCCLVHFGYADVGQRLLEVFPRRWDEFFVGGRCAVERRRHPNRIEDPLESGFDAIGRPSFERVSSEFWRGNGFGYSRREDQ